MRPDVACHAGRQAEGELQVAACQARPAGTGAAGASAVTVTVAQVLVAVSTGATAPAEPAQPLQSPVVRLKLRWWFPGGAKSESEGASDRNVGYGSNFGSGTGGE